MKLTYNGAGLLRKSVPDYYQEEFDFVENMGDMSIMGDPQSTSQVIVAARVRPLLVSDRPNEMMCVQAVPQAQQIILGNKCFQFPVDYAFPLDTPQSQVFDTAVQPLMDRLLQGYDTSVVTYGQTATGKTYTMLGPGVSFHISETEYGIIPRATRYLFSKLKQEPTKKFLVKVSFVSVQSEIVRDLLLSSQYQQELMLLESDAGFPVITGLQEVECESIEVLYSYLQVGMENRQLEWSNARQVGRPAQSHSIFTLSLEQQWVSPEGTMEQRLSIARFADLASSEKMYYRGMGGHVLGETIHMDPGLIAVGKVIQSLSHPTEWMCYSSSKELYRQSTLTRILKESFGGRCYSLVLCCISPALPHFDESLVTLQFAERLRQIRNTPVMNGLSVKVQTDSANDLMIPNGHISLISNEGRTGDTFGIEFATSQWIKLVTSAEGLFNKLVKSNTLSRQERDEIDKWLCLKHECEECIESDDGASISGNDGRLLEKIDEVTETEEKTDSSKEAQYPTRDREDDLKYDSETESDIDSQRPDFVDKLVKYYEKFKYRTDEEVNRKQDEYRAKSVSLDNGNPEDYTEEISRQHPIRNCLPNNGRRRSIHPGSQLPFMALGLNGPLSQGLNTTNIALDNEDEGDKMDVLQDKSTEFEKQAEEDDDSIKHEHLEPEQERRILLIGHEGKQNQMKQVEIDVKGIQKRIEELQATIMEKEQFIQDIHNNADTRANAKQRFLEKKTKLEEEYYIICSQIAQVQNILCKTASPSEENSKCKKDLERKAEKYDTRLKNMEIIKQITGASAKMRLELEQSLQSSKRLMDKLTVRLQKEEGRKISLQQELLKTQEKIKELQAKCNPADCMVEENVRNESAAGSKDRDLRWIKEEEERQVSMRESSQRLQEQLLQTQTMLDKRGALLKEKICLEKQRARNILEVSARISHLDQVLKDKSTDLEKIKDEDEKEALRMEIHNLRSTRDCLIEQRCALDDKFQKEKTLSTLEERKLLECDEAIEAIDAAIEYKNNLICGRKGGFEAGGREKGEEMLMARLNKLSDMEMRMLLYKYFQKVIDLRESGRKLEVQLTEKEAQNDKLTWQVQTLTHALQQYRLQAEREIILLQRQHQEKLHLMLRTFAEESSGGGGASSGTETMGNQNHRIDKEEQSSLKAENRRLHRRLQDLEATLQKLQTGRRTGSNFPQGSPLKDPCSRTISPEPVRPEPIPNKNLKQLRAAASALTTKVTRQKNKLIIQQQKAPSSSRSKQTNN